ncbi:hypothetical protein P2318_28045 [Myxococcaceae bacterium GXIMD 01537]
MSNLFRQRALTGLVLASLLGTGCEPPPVVPTADRRQNTHTSRIEGSVLVQGRARGNAVVFLYDADRPPPPQGSGRPLAFTVIPREQLYGAALDTPDITGPFIAPFALSLVGAGRYTVRGFIDSDTCRTGGVQPCHGEDFIPWYDVTAQPNTGDVAGAALDASLTRPRVIEVGENPDGTLNAVTGITVTFSESATTTVPLDRPAFRVEGTRRMEGASPKVLKLKPEPIQGGVMDLRPNGFFVRFVDDNNDGIPDDANGDGVPEVWPRVVVRKLADAPSLADENDLDRNSVLDEQGKDYPRMDGTLDGKPDLVVLQAALVTDALIPVLAANGGKAIVPELTVGINPRALDARDPRAPVPLQAMPSGRYSITLIQFTGQTWRVPNELDPLLAGPLGLPAVESQSFVIEVP